LLGREKVTAVQTSRSTRETPKQNAHLARGTKKTLHCPESGGGEKDLTIRERVCRHGGKNEFQMSKKKKGKVKAARSPPGKGLEGHWIGEKGGGGLIRPVWDKGFREKKAKRGWSRLWGVFFREKNKNRNRCWAPTLSTRERRGKKRGGLGAKESCRCNRDQREGVDVGLK